MSEANIYSTISLGGASAEFLANGNPSRSRRDYKHTDPVTDKLYNLKLVLRNLKVKFT